MLTNEPYCKVLPKKLTKLTRCKWTTSLFFLFFWKWKILFSHFTEFKLFCYTVDHLEETLFVLRFMLLSQLK